MTAPSYKELFLAFGRIGCLSFGGPAAQIALMHRELVEDRGWLDEAGYLRALSLCMLLPGPEAMQLATYAGWRLRGVPGGLLAGALFVLPGAAVIALLMAVYVTWGEVPLVEAAFLGIKAAVIAIVLAALRGLSKRALAGPADWIIAGLSFLGIFVFDLPFPLILACAAAWGLIRARAAAAPPVARAAGQWRDTGRSVLIWGGLWLLPLAGLSLAGPALLAQIGWFFAWLATISFGGAYALLAYLAQTAAGDFGWISPDQMIDALGLAETTPGPLILVTQFVAMLAGHASGGFAMALAAGAVGLWATFLPCFLFIFAAAPHMERLTHAPRLSAALKAITAAVVGVILNLSVWFALNVFFAAMSEPPAALPGLSLPVPGSVDPVAVGLFAVSAAALFVLRLPLIAVLAVAAVLGIVVVHAGG